MTDQTNLELDLGDIDAQIAKLLAKREELKSRKFDDAIAQISKIMTESGISLADIQAKFGVKKAKTEEKSTTKAKIAFVGPNGEKWSGRGRPARWVSELEKDGGSRETYKVAVTKKETANEQAENPSTI